MTITSPPLWFGVQVLGLIGAYRTGHHAWAIAIALLLGMNVGAVVGRAARDAREQNHG